MFKKILSDEWVAKIRKMPDFANYIIAALSFFAANAYATIISGEDGVLTLSATFSDATGVQLANPVLALIVFCLIDAVVSEIIFELINHIAAGIFIARFSARTNRADFKFRLRLCIIYANLITALIGICYFFTQTTGGEYTGTFILFGQKPNIEYGNDVYAILTSFVPFSLTTFFVWVFFDDFRIRFLSAKKQARAFSYVGRLYFGISLIFSFGQAISFAILTVNTLTVCETVAIWVEFGVTVLWTVGAYLYYRKLKKNEDIDNSDDQPPFIVVENETKKGNIYDDLGF